MYIQIVNKFSPVTFLFVCKDKMQYIYLVVVVVARKKRLQTIFYTITTRPTKMKSHGLQQAGKQLYKFK